MSRRRLLRPGQIRALLLDSEPWLSCDECFNRVDRYVEHLLAGSSGHDELMTVHLIACPACLDEAESLLTLRAADLGMPAQTALQTLATELAANRGAP